MFPNNKLEETLAAAQAGSIPMGEILKVLATSDLWLPLPTSTPTEQGAELPVILIEGHRFVPVYTSAEQLQQGAGQTGHAVIKTQELIKLIPNELGLAINPGGEVGLPVFPSGLQVLRSTPKTVNPGQAIRLGEPAENPEALLEHLSRAFNAMPEVTSARRALIQVGENDPSLLIGVTLGGTSQRSRDAVLSAVSRTAAQVQVPFSIDTTFLGSPGDQTSEWMLSNIEPFYSRR